MQQQHTGIIVVLCKTPSLQMFPLLAINAHAVQNTTVCVFFSPTTKLRQQNSKPQFQVGKSEGLGRLQVELQPLSGLFESCAIEYSMIKLHRQTNETKVKLS